MADIAVNSETVCLWLVDAVDSETVCLWLVDHSYDRAIKTLLSLAKLRFNDFLNALYSTVINLNRVRH